MCELAHTFLPTAAVTLFDTAVNGARTRGRSAMSSEVHTQQGKSSVAHPRRSDPITHTGGSDRGFGSHWGPRRSYCPHPRRTAVEGKIGFSPRRTRDGWRQRRRTGSPLRAPPHAEGRQIAERRARPDVPILCPPYVEGATCRGLKTKRRQCLHRMAGRGASRSRRQERTRSPSPAQRRPGAGH